MLQTINNKIQQGFGRSAKSYDCFASLHREIADKLLAQVIKGPKPSALLDVGCGTGYLTVKLREHFSQSRIIGLDFSQEMLSLAAAKHDGIDWVLADCNHLPFSDGLFDILISNLAYQWAGDLAQALTEARRTLSANGILAATLFGYHTCQELFQSLDEARPGELQFTRLPDQSQVAEALIMSGFQNPKVDSERIKIEFKDMYELITWLKFIGANNLGREGYLGARAMARAADIFRKRFACQGGVETTFEVMRIYAKK